jgi:hypothetical protein
MSEAVVIEGRFRGPPDSANGGYACGLLAARAEPAPAVEVTLRAPPPLDRPMGTERDGDGVRLLDGEQLVAEARPAAVPAFDLPEPVSLEDARRARELSPMQTGHPYPMCFVCGSDRARGDGLCVTCGRVPGREGQLVAAPFETDETMAAEDGSVRDELVWSVLDCPGGIAGMLVPDLGLSVLGRLTAAIHEPLEAGRDYVAVGWPTERDGRKCQAAAAILDTDGRALAISDATWIELRPPADGAK